MKQIKKIFFLLMTVLVLMLCFGLLANLLIGKPDNHGKPILHVEDNPPATSGFVRVYYYPEDDGNLSHSIDEDCKILLEKRMAKYKIFSVDGSYYDVSNYGECEIRLTKQNGIEMDLADFHCYHLDDIYYCDYNDGSDEITASFIVIIYDITDITQEEISLLMSYGLAVSVHKGTSLSDNIPGEVALYTDCMVVDLSCSEIIEPLEPNAEAAAVIDLDSMMDKKNDKDFHTSQEQLSGLVVSEDTETEFGPAIWFQ